MNSKWNEVRAEFPSLDNWTFLNTATFGQMPRRATAAITDHIARRTEHACHDFLDWFDDHDRLRGKIATLVHCDPTDVAFLPNASSGLSLLLTGLPWEPGDEILTLKDEFPNQIYHPSALGQNGVVFVETSWQQLREAVKPRTRVVLFSSVNYVTGFRPPLEGLSEFLRERGVLLVIDGTQSVGALEFDWSRYRPDLLVVNTYKWMLTPNGVGFMVVHPDLRQRLSPKVIGWRSHKGWRDVDDLHHGAPEFVSSAEKYEGGMLPSALLYALEAVVDWMLSLGPAEIERRVLDLAAEARQALRECDGKLLYDKGLHYESGIVAARFDAKDASELATALLRRRVLTSARHGYLRVSTHLYNNSRDIAALKDALLDAL
jgi:cysteine desulfurase / selenocysteine lyase